MEYICKICGKKFESNANCIYAQQGSISQSFKKHLKNDHNLTLKDYILKYYFNDEIPKCKCGCGELLTFREKNALWDPLNSFGKYVHCGHVGRNNEQLKSKLKESYKSKYDNIEWARNHYYSQYGKDIIENSAKDFLTNDDLNNMDIQLKYGLDFRTLKGIWSKLNLVNEEQWKERCKFHKFKLSGKHRKTKFPNKEFVCDALLNIAKNNPFKYNIRSLIDFYNENGLTQIETEPQIVLEELEKLYGNEIYDYLEYSRHSKEEKKFLEILKFFMKKLHYYKCGFRLQYGENKRKSYIYDICIDNKYIIEYDGIFYHTEDNKERDLEKENFAIDKGYKFIRVSSEDFTNINIYKQIINFIEND